MTKSTKITFRREAQLRVCTPDAPPYEREPGLFDSIPVETVGSYAEAEGLFDDQAHGPPPFGMQFSTDEKRQRSTRDRGCGAGRNLRKRGQFHRPHARIVTSLVGALPFVYAGYLFRSAGWREGAFVLTTSVEEVIDAVASPGGADSEKSATVDYAFFRGCRL